MTSMPTYKGGISFDAPSGVEETYEHSTYIYVDNHIASTTAKSVLRLRPSYRLQTAGVEGAQKSPLLDHGS